MVDTTLPPDFVDGARGGGVGNDNGSLPVKPGGRGVIVTSCCPPPMRFTFEDDPLFTVTDTYALESSMSATIASADLAN